VNKNRGRASTRRRRVVSRVPQNGTASEMLRTSRTHTVDNAEVLGAFLREQQLDRLERILSERGLRLGEWFAEHASAQLSSASACITKPQWAAWCAPAAGISDCEAGESSDGAAGPSAGVLAEVGGDATAAAGARIVVLWAEDARAARRAVVALQLRRACPVRVLLPRAFFEQLERCACEAESGSVDFGHLSATDALELSVDGLAGGSSGASGHGAVLLPDGSPVPDGASSAPRGFEAWGSLFELSGEALVVLRERRVVSAEEDAAETRRKISELSRALLALDPEATIEAEPEGDRRAGRHGLMVHGCFDGHNVNWGGPIDKFASVADVVRAVRASCGCC